MHITLLVLLNCQEKHLSHRKVTYFYANKPFGMMRKQCTLDNIPHEFWFDLWLFIETAVFFIPSVPMNMFQWLVLTIHSQLCWIAACWFAFHFWHSELVATGSTHHLSDATGCCKTSTFLFFYKILMLMHQPLQTLHFDMWCVLKLMLKACPFFTLVFLLLAYSACACWIAACIVCLLFISWLDIE